MSLFDLIWTVVNRRRTLRELRSLETNKSGGGYWEFRNLIEEAQDVFERDQRVRAAQIMAQVRSEFPDSAMKSPEALALMLNLKLYDEAESLLVTGQKRYPANSHFMEGLALIAFKRGDREEALKRCIVLRRGYPRSLKGYGIAAAALSELNRPEEAEIMLAKGLRLMPKDIGLKIESARLATRRKDWAEALARWSDVYTIHGHLSGVVGAAEALTETGRYDEADQMLADVLHKAGNDVSVWLGFAKNAERRQDWVGAAQRWAKFRHRFPLNPVGYIGGLRPQLAMNAHDEADDIIKHGIYRMPDESALLVEYAWLAHRRGDWTAATRRWADVREKYPTLQEGYIRGSDALDALGQTCNASRIRTAGGLLR
jgi:predicted Zn-dependent protease